MHFRHSERLWADFPELVAVALCADGIVTDADVRPYAEPLIETARARLTDAAESELPEIQAWRRAYGRMGLKPTQYRCASEALLRRFRKDDDLPRIHPLVDLCNAVSLAYATPIAVIDLDRVTGDLEVTYAKGSESSTTFRGEAENPAPGEVIYLDGADSAHARRWTNKQSGLSTVRPETGRALIVAEALHDTAQADVPQLGDRLARLLDAAFATEQGRTVTAGPTVLRTEAPDFEA